MLNLKQRYELYKRLWFFFSFIVTTQLQENGLCSAVMQLSDSPLSVYNPSVFQRLLPELYKQHPRVVLGTWWDYTIAGHRKRIIALEKAIQEVEYKLKTLSIHSS